MVLLEKFLNGLHLYARVDELAEEMVLSLADQPRTRFTPAEIARDLNIDRRSVPRIIDQDLDLFPLRKRKV